jgi:PilZ domain-containing protein
MANLAYSLRMLTPSLSRAACGHLPSNRRGEMRRALRLGCRVRRRDGRLVGDRTADLSPQGMLLFSDERLEPDAELVVCFQATELPLWFDTRATLRRVVEGRRPGDGGRALGLKFDSLPAVSRLILRGHLGKAPQTVPKREPPPELVPRRPFDYADAVLRTMLEPCEDEEEFCFMLSRPAAIRRSAHPS